MLDLPQELHDGILTTLRDRLGSTTNKMQFIRTGGGCINPGGKLTLNDEEFFVKWNDVTRFPGMFEAEARGLNLLASTQAIRVPEVLAVSQNGSFQFIIMEFIHSAGPGPNCWIQLGERLANLHRSAHECFGLDHHNYMGSLIQLNHQHTSWSEFFISERLEVQLRLALDNGAVSRYVVRKFQRLYQKLPSILTQERPSLVHGDLWNGNLMIDEAGEPCLIDPAVYYGHREVDLAMTQLFGGFDRVFYDSYKDAFRLEPGYQERLDIYNLYPLLVHVNLFGQGYLHQVNAILDALVP